MSIWTSLFTGSSGLTAFGEALGVVGDNIANVSTTGFKASRAGFEDVLGSTAANGQRMGSGVHMTGPEGLFHQGSFSNTGRSLDMAVRGQGFFVVRGAHDGIDGTYYTRDGRFGFDADGNIVNTEGLRLQGYQIDATGRMGSALGDLRVERNSPPNPTTTMALNLNLDASSITPPAAWDPADPTGTSNYATSVTVYDSLGAAHHVDVYFRNNGAGQWEWHAMVDGAEIDGGTPGIPSEIADGTLAFDANGALDTETINNSNASFVGATPNQAINFDFGDAITSDGGTGLSGTTQFAGASNVRAVTQDGFAAGTLLDVQIAEDGTISGVYSNGQTRPVARVALAAFQSSEGLRRSGSQLYSETIYSGAAAIDAVGTGSRGSVTSGALEGSNVDLGSELVTLISYQRAFQANARTVTTADEMLAETANLKR